MFALDRLELKLRIVGVRMSEQSSKPRNNRALWTIADFKFIEEHYGSMSPAEIAAKLGRTQGALELMADKLGVRRQRSPTWTAEEEAILRKHYVAGAGIEQLLRLLPGRQVNAIFLKARRLGLTSGRYWREAECQILREYYPEYGTAIAERWLGRTEDSVKLKASELGIKFLGQEGKFRIWSEEEWGILEKYLHLSIAEQMQLLPGRSRQAVEKARERLRARKKANLSKADK
ncbi:hypothetical protein C9426_33135 [Serratia sp. S1B]|nr:hypothetical protein C9426_33135 [Serratia sp. S1B]